jgi:hypothetical protein
LKYSNRGIKQYNNKYAHKYGNTPIQWYCYMQL